MLFVKLFLLLLISLPPSQVSRVQPTVYALMMNNSLLQLEAHNMSDGSLLLSLHEASYTAYMKEEPDGYRVVIGGKTCVFEKENDPRVLRCLLLPPLSSFLPSPLHLLNSPFSAHYSLFDFT